MCTWYNEINHAHHFLDHDFFLCRIAHHHNCSFRSLLLCELTLNHTHFVTMSKTILVTGASRGIGLACARILLDKFSCNVVTLSRSMTSELEELSKQFEGKIEVVQGDVAKSDDQKVRIARWYWLEELDADECALMGDRRPFIKPSRNSVVSMDLCSMRKDICFKTKHGTSQGWQQALYSGIVGPQLRIERMDIERMRVNLDSSPYNSIRTLLIRSFLYNRNALR